MNDILLSGLLNLFALFGAVNRTDKSRSLQMLSNYLTKHFGVRMLDDYLPLYSEDPCIWYFIGRHCRSSGSGVSSLGLLRISSGGSSCPHFDKKGGLAHGHTFRPDSGRHIGCRRD